MAFSGPKSGKDNPVEDDKVDEKITASTLRTLSLADFVNDEEDDEFYVGSPKGVHLHRRRHALRRSIVDHSMSSSPPAPSFLAMYNERQKAGAEDAKPSIVESLAPPPSAIPKSQSAIKK